MDSAEEAARLADAAYARAIALGDDAVDTARKARLADARGTYNARTYAARAARVDAAYERAADAAASADEAERE